MVFESLINPFQAEKTPLVMVAIGALYSSVAILLSLFIFEEHASLVMIFLTVIASIPLMYSTIKMEEKKDLKIADERVLLKEHGKALSFLVFLFIGFVVAFTAWYLVLPQQTTAALFSTQLTEIGRVEKMSVTGNAVTLVGVFGKIFFNNLTVMLFSLLFALFYGVGSMYILTWNASLIGAAIGTFAREAGSSYFHSLPLGMLRYLIHGIPEMFGYFMAGLAGGILSVAVIRHNFKSEHFKHVVFDSLDMIFLSVIVLFCAALLEVFVTPLFFY